MLHRLTLRLYDENPMDAEILDFLADYDGPRKQDLLRTMLRIGFNELYKSPNSKKVKKVIDEDVRSLVVSKSTRRKKSEVSHKEVKVNEVIDEEVIQNNESDYFSNESTDKKIIKEPVTNADYDELDPLAMLAGKIK